MIRLGKVRAEEWKMVKRERGGGRTNVFFGRPFHDFGFCGCGGHFVGGAAVDWGY